MSTQKEKVVLALKYRKGTRKLHNLCLPALNHLNDGFYCFDAEITQSGIIERGGARYEFQDIRVLVKAGGQQS